MSTEDDRPAERGGDPRELVVVTRAGSRHRFLRGMITHDLVQRGLEFEQAYEIASRVRDHLRGRGEVTKEEIGERILAELHRLHGPRLPERLAAPAPAAPDILVAYHGRRIPFSRGLLARSILASGVDLERAYQMASEVYDELRRELIDVTPSDEIVRRVADLLEKREGTETASRYRMIRGIPRLPRPVVVYIGGATGTGKSTLALELAPLLRIYRINATDTIRQVMRMVFTPSVLPALHGSSFEKLVGEPHRGGPWVDQEALRARCAPFSEQAERVMVGVRAVVERAIAENMSLVIEGVHLYPPLVPFADLEGAVYQVPLLLGTLDEEIHRSRFLARARLGGRRAERYLEHFRAIRDVQDMILNQAELHEVPLIDTSDAQPPVDRALGLFCRLLERQLPAEKIAPDGGRSRRPPTLLLIIDGMPDRPVRALGGRTPLQAANTPTLDRLAREGRTGLADPVAPGVVADTAAGTLALLGQSPLALKRGPVEALGAGIDLGFQDVALRGNLATVDDAGNVIDRRAGRVREETPTLARAIDRLSLPGSLAEEIEVRVRPTTEHRLAVVLRGEGLSSAIQGSDPGEGSTGPALTPRPLDPENANAVGTARALALFEQQARRVLTEHPVNRRRRADGLPVANAVLTRGAGRLHRLLPLEEAGLPLRFSCVAGDRTVLGLGSWLGARTFTEPTMTANMDTDLEAKFATALRLLESSDLVAVHVKGADIAAHDRRPDLKVAFLERLDAALGRALDGRAGNLRIAVASDHATLSESGQHVADPLPVLIWGEALPADGSERFDEQSVAGGELGRFPLQMLMRRLYDLT